MATINLGLRTGLVDIDKPTTGTSGFSTLIGVRALSVTLGSNPQVWKNHGYYTTGSVWETWLSTGSPSTFNPDTSHGPAQFSEIYHEQVRA